MNTDNKYAVGIDIGTDSVKVVVGREERSAVSQISVRGSQSLVLGGQKPSVCERASR